MAGWGPAPRPWLTGHSLGGAIAHLLALRFAVAGLSVAEVVTFGAPQVTDATGAPALPQQRKWSHERMAGGVASTMAFHDDVMSIQCCEVESARHLCISGKCPSLKLRLFL